MSMNGLQLLQAWYRQQCNGVWEHSWGIKIDTLDNPGWTIKVDLSDTPLQHAEFEEKWSNRDHETDWLFCRVKDNVFEGHCGIDRLEEMLMVFLEWSRSVSNVGGS
jgi:hypothetical protein